MFENMSDRDIELFLWEKGTTIHQKNPQERSEIVILVYSNRAKLNIRSQCHFVGYVMHSYFFNMSVKDRRYIIKLLVEDRSYEMWGDKVEMLGILYKMCPHDVKTDVWEYIYCGAEHITMSDIDIIAFCNSVRYIFDEVSKRKQRLLYNRLLSIEKVFASSPAASTMAYTLNNVRKVMK